MTFYSVWLKDSDSCFFVGEAETKDEAIESAVDAYLDKYPEEFERDEILHTLFVAQEIVQDYLLVG